MTVPLLHLDRVSRRYGGLLALHELDLTIPAGARHAIIGANGAGKSTLFHLIAGTVRPTNGRITFDGVDVTASGAAARARLGVGRTFQHPAVVDTLTAAANVELALTRRLQGPRPGRRRDEAAAVLDAADLSEHAATPAGELPYGLRRRLELTVAVAAQPRLLLLDEPSAGLDPQEVTRLTATIRALPADLTVLLIDHHLDLVWDLADTVTVLHHGRHLTTGPVHAVRTDPDVHAAYLTAPVTAARGDEPAPRTATAAAITNRRTPPSLLQVRGLRAGYQGAAVLHDITFDVPAGAVVAVLGRNGAGKTTMLNAVAGLHPRHPNSQVHLDATPLPGRPDQAARAGIGIVPQGRRLFDLTVSEHLTLAAATARRRSTDTSAAPTWTRDDLLGMFPPLAARLAQPAARLSGGEQQMLALARALLGRPRLLLLDEPTEGLAPAVVADLATAIGQIAAGGVTVLLAEQHQPFALHTAEHVLVLDRGRIVLDTPATTVDDPAVRTRLDQALGVAARSSR
ncbi:ATP-binding cassette domain-containing protein [Dactylosporangium vinaceum]|uniref:ATP-binding cassette domain-containing protein n=1 Tax=Dactylosporangium vinaceum TaxID=53362 RepID=A0ABV5M2L6_9ACTN|nr:ATP-binding cassette domain-containing protein [Dactylosporangium vinaceum]UAB96322.1 ATP-binding cassette domain-containing protein [Dactylosporangium vinaceum]